MRQPNALAPPAAESPPKTPSAIPASGREAMSGVALRSTIRALCRSGRAHTSGHSNAWSTRLASGGHWRVD
jgi:hypothetical protein